MTITEQIQNANSFDEIFAIVKSLPHNKDHDRLVLTALARYMQIKEGK